MRRVLSGSGIQPNKNTDWLNEKGFWAFYVVILGVCVVSLNTVLNFFRLPTMYTWMGVHIIHCMITFPIMHWRKGTPFSVPEDQGQYNHLTFWEQIDDEVQYTPVRKLFMLVPLFLFSIATWASELQLIPLFVDLVALLFALVPKSGLMHRVRIGGINKD